ncbi:MAG: hypothetical protein R3247_00465 [Rhodothermales bacterium]|nr:hypothetical protein [Rhodothermales bacterium]
MPRLTPLLLALLLAATGCDTAETTIEATPADGVFVANQGNFSDNNGSVTLYLPETGQTLTVLDDVGTLVQSLTLTDDRAYVLSNTADAVEILDMDLEPTERIGRISGVPSPRYLAEVAPNKAYVSNLFAGTVTVVDLGARRVTGTIPVGANPEDIAVIDGRAYVANSGFGAGTTLTVIDVATDAATGTVDVGCDGPRHLEADREGELWVVCTGKTVYNDDFTEIIEQTHGAVVVLDGATGAGVARFALGAQAGAASFGQDLFYAPASGDLFAVQGTGLLVFDAATNTAAGRIDLAGEAPIGGVAYDAAAGRLYVARIPDFTTAGFVTLHDRSGAEIGRFPAGVAPGHIVLADR